MQTIIQLSEIEAAKALPILLKRFSGTVLSQRIYVLHENATQGLHEAGIQFTELSRVPPMSRFGGVGVGERV